MTKFERLKKWEGYYLRKHKITPARETTFILTAKNALELLGSKRNGTVLDIGCGFGEIDILLAENTNFSIVGCDISEAALTVARKNVEKAGLGERIKIEWGDVYNLQYPDNYFDIVLSFGYVSAATYPGVQEEIARVLKPGGILICDFINHLSFYKIFQTFKNFLKKRKLLYSSLASIRSDFEEKGFQVLDQRLFNTYPPINFSPKFLLFFENTMGKIFKNFLGRVRLIKFQKR